MRRLLTFLVVLTVTRVVHSFCPNNNGDPRIAFTKSRLEAIPDGTTAAPIVSEALEASRTSFFIWFFGASGAAGIARSAFPRMYKSVVEIQELKDVGPTLGGETLGLSPICGYPQDLCRADVEQVANNRMTVSQIVAKYPVEGNFLSSKGYLTFPAFAQANEKANPLAVRAVFDSFAQSTDAVNPDVAQDKLDSYKENVESLKPILVKSKLVGIAAIVTLLFLLGLADIVAFGHAYDGWFPEWPGGRNFPACMIDPETGPWTIPKYWI